ncbi:Cell division cycle protein [Alternaria alternata]|nr:Cell division cycle protein [Alternaria alternata]
MARYLLMLETCKLLKGGYQLRMPFVVGAVQDVLLSDWWEGQLSIPHLYWCRGGVVACRVLCAHGGWGLCEEKRRNLVPRGYISRNNDSISG